MDELFYELDTEIGIVAGFDFVADTGDWDLLALDLKRGNIRRRT